MLTEDLAHGLDQQVVLLSPPFAFEPHPDAGMHALIERVPPFFRRLGAPDACVRRVGSRCRWSNR
jgi:hypothetical protein